MIEHGISFGELHSFRDLDLILSGVEIPPASPKETYIEIPGADGSLDMTEAHGEVKYDDRTGAKFIFAMNPSGDLSESAWTAKKKEIENRLNGWRGNITLDKDPDYFWEGRCKVDQFASNKRLRQIVVGARLAPYKLKNELTRIVCPVGSGKNLLKLSEKCVSKTENGVSFTVNKDGSITIQTEASGAGATTDLLICGNNIGANAENAADIFEQGWKQKVDYLFSLQTPLPSGVYSVQYYYRDDGTYITNGVLASGSSNIGLVFNSATKWYCHLTVQVGTIIAEPITIYPMLEEGTSMSEYEPYGTYGTVTLPNSRKTVCPTIICESETTLTVDGAEYVVSSGTHKVLDLQLHEGETEVTVTGSGEVIFEYQEGDL